MGSNLKFKNLSDKKLYSSIKLFSENWFYLVDGTILFKPILLISIFLNIFG